MPQGKSRGFPMIYDFGTQVEQFGYSKIKMQSNAKQKRDIIDKELEEIQKLIEMEILEKRIVHKM
ncbi:hypothetical protein WN51_07450 [Melipona quadrifasciata]|uniref:Uncharacterized protein n=1 Tax=Melipona quadrifasciata TaxID=166423 RepID=A0A0M9A9G5_9HYME|nr:hypothetical protein WN51_07450 [Melipona quadrifasciata]